MWLISVANAKIIQQTFLLSQIQPAELMTGINSVPAKAACNAVIACCPFLWAVEMYPPRIRQNLSAHVSVRKVPETFCLSFTIRISRSARLVSKGTLKSYMKASTSRGWAFSRSSKFLGGVCLIRPRCFTGGSTGGGANGKTAVCVGLGQPQPITQTAEIGRRNDAVAKGREKAEVVKHGSSVDFSA